MTEYVWMHRETGEIATMDRFGLNRGTGPCMLLRPNPYFWECLGEL
jgi:hypothetical protein